MRTFQNSIPNHVPAAVSGEHRKGWLRQPLRLCWCGITTLLICVSLASGQTDVPLRLLPPLSTEIAAETSVDEIIEPPTPTADSISGWLQPTNWFTSPVWDFGMELGVNGSEGNYSVLQSA